MCKFVNHFVEPIPINAMANMKISIDRIMLTVSWQVCISTYIHSCDMGMRVLPDIYYTILNYVWPRCLLLAATFHLGH